MAGKIATLLSTAALCVVATSLTAGPAMGEEAKAAAPAADTGVGEVVVTAQRRAQSLQEVPLSIAAFNAEAIQKVAINSIEGLNGLASNVVVEHVGLFPAAASLSMRGVGVSGIESFNDPDVAVYINDVYQPRNAIALSSTVDVDSIEVLRGPQGTLYGRNAYAGVISLKTKRPVMDEMSGEAAVTFGNYERIDGEFVGNVPIVNDKLALRLAVRQHQFEGFYKNNGIIDAAGTVDQSLRGQPVGGQNTLYVRPSLRYTPNEKWDIQFVGEWYRERSDAYPAFAGPGTTGLAALGYPGINPFGDPAKGTKGDGSDPFSVGYNLKGKPANYDSWSLVNDTSYKTDIGTFRGIFSYARVKEDVWADTDGQNINAFSSARWQDYNSTTAELMYVSDFSDRFNIVSGLSYLHDHYQTTQLSFSKFTLPFPADFTPFTVNPSYINNTGFRTAWAAYAQGEYHITKPLSFVFGIRYSFERKYGYKGENTTLSAAGFAPTLDFSKHVFTTNSALLFVAPAYNWDNFAPRVGVNYKVDDDVLLYAFWQRAFKSGGFNANAADKFAFITPFGEESVDSYEGGIKSDWFQHRLRANVNFFYAQYNNLQRSLVTASPTAPSGVTTVTTNAANVRSYGIEAELAARPTRDLRLFANIGWNPASYTSYCADLDGAEATTTPANGRAVCGPITTVTTSTGATNYLVPTDNSHLQPVRAPRWDITGGFNQDFAFKGGVISVDGSVNYRSKTWTNLNNVPYSLRDAMVVVDADVVWRPENDRYSITFWARNLTNEIALLNITPVAGQFAFANATDPRTYGVTLRTKF